MNRRYFLKTGAVAAAVLAGIPILTTGCRTNLRTRLMEKQPSPEIPGLSPEGHRILHYASLAPSGHNSQPWFVRINAPEDWTIGLDTDRRLPVVDKNNTEALLSIGAFLENMVQAAAAHGYRVHTTIIAKDRFDPDFNPDLVSIRLEKTHPENMDLRRLTSRRTVKTHLSDRQLTPKDVNAFSHLADGHLFYFAKGTTHADHMTEQAVANYISQMKNRKAVREMAKWTRLKDSTIKEHRDGLTPAGMEIQGLAGWYVRHVMNPADVTRQTFIDKGIEKTRYQAKEGAGWLVITGDGNTVADLIASGRRFQRMALEAKNKMIAIHPMSQTLEETRGQKHITENHSPGTIPHFMLRVGYLDKYPDPVSIRRPVTWFVRI